METRRKTFSKIISSFLAVLMLFSVIPFSSITVNAATAVPEEMQDNYVIRSLDYLGYNIDYLKANGLLYATGWYGPETP